MNNAIQCVITEAVFFIPSYRCMGMEASVKIGMKKNVNSNFKTIFVFFIELRNDKNQK